MAQSTNDTIPTNIRLSTLSQLGAFVAAFEELRAALVGKAKEFDDIVKAGRTHLQDAMPIRLGQEFAAYAGSIDRGIRRVKEAADYLRDLGIGGSAVGTGVTVEPEYPALMVKHLKEISGLELGPAPAGTTLFYTYFPSNYLAQRPTFPGGGESLLQLSSLVSVS